MALSITLNAQADKLFEYSDSTFEAGSIYLLPLVYCYNGAGRLGRCDLNNPPIIEELSIFINNYPSYVFQIECHTDSRGSDSYNKRLSLHRAEILKIELEAQYGVDSLKLIKTPCSNLNKGFLLILKETS